MARRSSKVVEEMAGSASGTRSGPVGPETGVIEVAEAIENAIPNVVSSPFEEVAVVKVDVAFPTVEVAAR